VSRGSAAMRNIDLVTPLEPLNPLHYDEDRVMIGHPVDPMEQSSDGVFWCRVCGGHPEDPIHQSGFLA
jgi:hypothetical protein